MGKQPNPGRPIAPTPRNGLICPAKLALSRRPIVWRVATRLPPEALMEPVRVVCGHDCLDMSSLLALIEGYCVVRVSTWLDVPAFQVPACLGAT